LAARTHTYARPTSRQGRPNGRTALAILCSLVAVIAIPVAIELTRKLAGAQLIDAAWAIPVAAFAAVASLMFERGARSVATRTLERAGGSRRLMAAHVFAVTGICLTLSSSLAVGIYEFLVWKERH
jgi:steroid 5-alpha reductase family enzyme